MLPGRRRDRKGPRRRREPARIAPTRSGASPSVTGGERVRAGGNGGLTAPRDPGPVPAAFTGEGRTRTQRAGALPRGLREEDFRLRVETVTAAFLLSAVLLLFLTARRTRAAALVAYGGFSQL